VPYKNVTLRNASASRRRKLLGDAAPPKGFAPRKVTTGKDGKVIAVQSVPSGKRTEFKVQPAGQYVKGLSTLLDAEGQVVQQWVKTDAEKADRDALLEKALHKAMAKYRGVVEPTAPRTAFDTDTETFYPLGDPHIGMLAWAPEVGGQSFDLKIAERELTRAVEMLVARSPSSEVGVIVNVGDFFHAQDDNQRTPASGNKLDVDCRAAKVLECGFRVFRTLVDLALRKHKVVHVINAAGNHDRDIARFLALWLKALYEREPRVVVADAHDPFIYRRFGRNLIGVYHGDGAKREDLGQIMATDRPQDWGDTDYRLWLTGHIHHDTRKELRGCVVESFRTMAPRDMWHHWKGYRSERSLSAITLHREWGECSRVTVGIREVKAEAKP
jgi:hypothetical protein